MQELHFGQALLPTGWARDVRVRIADGRIAAVDAGAADAGSAEWHALAVPGLCNGHSHAFQRALAGLTELRGASADSFWTWRERLYAFLAHLGPEELEAVTAQAFVEMLESGFTRVGEFHYVHHDAHGRRYADLAEMAARVASAAAETGIGLTLLPVFYAHGGFGGKPPGDAQRRFVCSIEEFARLLAASESALARLPDASLGLAPHSLRAVAPDELAALAVLAADRPIHIHIAEQEREVADCLAWSGQRPVAWLLEHAPVAGHWSLIHATHIDEHELRGIVASAAVVGLCPITEADLGDGIFPAPEYLAAGGRISVGTDSNVLIDAAGELRLLEYGQRLVRRARNVLAAGAHASTGRTLFDAAHRGGAVSLGLKHAGLVPGAAADLVSIDPDGWLAGGRDGDVVLDGWIFAARRPAVDCVWRAGRKVVAAGRHIGAGPIAARFARAMRTLTRGPG